MVYVGMDILISDLLNIILNFVVLSMFVGGIEVVWILDNLGVVLFGIVVNNEVIVIVNCLVKG